MKRLGPLCLMLALALGAWVAPARAGEGELNIFLGQKALDDDVFDNPDVDGQFQLGLTLSLDVNWPVHLAIDYLHSSDDATRNFVTTNPLQLDSDVDTTELDVGVRKFWGQNRTRMFLGGGLAMVWLDAYQTESGTLGADAPFTTVIVNDGGFGVGYWVNVGVLQRVGNHFNVGFDLRYSDADVDLRAADGSSSRNVESGGSHVGVLLGYHW